MKSRVSWLPASIALALAMGCGVVTIEKAPSAPAAGKPNDDAPRNLIAEGQAKQAAEAAAQAAAAMPADPGPCPADMTRSPGPLVVAAYGDDTTPAAKAPIAPEHEKPLRTDKKFARAPTAAMDALVAIEQATPGLVPVGFRDALATSPRDAALRLRMARCEMRDGALLRRASVDLAAALLLGASAEELRHDLDTVGTGRDCDAISPTLHRDAAKTCEEAERRLVSAKPSKVSAKELAAEDAVSRGLATLYAQSTPTDRPRRGVSGLLLDLVHRCGRASTCSVNIEKVWDPGASALAKPREELVHWDNNVRGSVVEVADPPALAAAKKRCRDATDGHWESRGPCLNGCIGTFNADSCRITCIASCSP
jgi:hypothetical protein